MCKDQGVGGGTAGSLAGVEMRAVRVPAGVRVRVGGFGADCRAFFLSCNVWASGGGGGGLVLTVKEQQQQQQQQQQHAIRGTQHGVRWSYLST